MNVQLTYESVNLRVILGFSARKTCIVSFETLVIFDIVTLKSPISHHRGTVLPEANCHSLERFYFSQTR